MKSDLKHFLREFRAFGCGGGRAQATVTEGIRETLELCLSQQPVAATEPAALAGLFGAGNVDRVGAA